MHRLDLGDVWKNKARSLQLQLRDRFRVAVDRHWRRRHHHTVFLPAEGYFSSTLQRWLNRFRDFRRDALPSSTSFYRKRVSRDFSLEEESIILRMMQAVAVPILGNVCHVFMNGLNRVQVYGLEKLHSALLERPKGKPLLTVSNHVASMDDPLVIASLLPPQILLDARNLRWTLCATDRCFKNPVTSAFFRSVKVLPLSRGDGIYQEGMDMALSKLNNGGWVHIFPEGSRSRDGGKTMGSCKRGVARFILDGDSMPIVIPFVHTGMQEIMPIGASIPRIGKRVTVIVGDPINFDDILNMEKGPDVPRKRLYDAVAARIGDRLHELKAQVDSIAMETEMRLKNHSPCSMERASGILQQVDWELFGMDNFISSANDDSMQTQEAVVLLDADVSEQHQQSHSKKVGFSYRMRGYMNQMELMSFAARGIFMNNNETKDSAGFRETRPLNAWKQFFDAQSVLMAEEEEESELSEKQKVEIAKWFLLNSPPGEIQYVAKDVKSILNDDGVFNEAASEAFPLYNKSHFIVLPMPDRSGDVLVTSFGELEDNAFLDPRTAQVAIVDHVKQVCEVVRPALDEELASAYIEEFRFSLDAEILKYVEEVYPKGVCSVYCVNGKDAEGPGFDFELAVVISASRHSPQNFCNGSWCSVWNIDFKDEQQTVEVKGKLQVGAHYFEEGNVQLDTKHECKDATLFQAPEDCALAISSIIRHHETEYLASLEASYLNLPDSTFKDLRRKLPVTRTLFPWHNTLQFSLTRDISKELGIGK